VVHAEFRARRALAAVVGAVRRPQSIRRPLVREAIAGVYHACRLPFLARRLDRQSRQQQSEPAVHITHVLSRQAAAMPSDPSTEIFDLHAREVEQHQ